MNVVELRRVTKRGSSLRNLHLELGRGEVRALSVLAGAEALTVARILALADEFEGEFFLMGTAVHQLSALQRRLIRRRHLGVVLRTDRLIPEVTVRENLELPLTRLVGRRDRDRRIDPILEELGLNELGDFFPRQLSERQVQLAKIARAAVGWPALLVGEELRAGLRRADWERVAGLLQRLRAGGTALALTSLNEAREMEGEAGRRSVEAPVEACALSWAV